MLDEDPIEEARQQWVAQGWESAAPGVALIGSLVRTQQIFVRRLEQELRPLELSLARFEVLMQLTFSRNGSMPLGRMRRRLQVAPGAVTNAIDRLEKDGLVRRQSDAADGRVTIASITHSGRARGLQAAKIVNERVYENLELNPELVDSLVDQLRVIRDHAGDFRSPH